MRLSPTLHNAAVMNTVTKMDAKFTQDNIDFWYDSLNDCYQNKMDFDMIALYIEAITDHDYE